jgi:hypothetical protein
MTFEILLNPSVPPEDELRLSKQAKRIYLLFTDAQRAGSLVSNRQLTQIGLQYAARLHEIRQALIAHNWCIDLARKDPNGVNWYGLVRLDQSQFYEKHRHKF